MKIRRIATFAFLLPIVALAVGLSSCDRITSIVTDGEMPAEEMPTEEMPQTTTTGIPYRCGCSIDRCTR